MYITITITTLNQYNYFSYYFLFLHTFKGIMQYERQFILSYHDVIKVIEDICIH